MDSRHNPRLAIAACAVALAFDAVAPTEIQLTPAGEFRAWDGRPADAPTWRMNAELAARLIDWVATRKTPCVIDYDHQTLLSKTNGKPAPAAGWYSALEWREGVGLFAVGVEWTAAAAAMIAAGEYRYISPFIAYDAAGNVTGLYMASLTNNPAIDGMDEVLLAAASALFPSTTPKEENMDELLEQLRWLLNLPVGATVQDVLAQLEKLKSQLTQGGTAAASFDLAGHLSAQQQAMADLSAKVGQTDPAAFVPMGQYVGLQNQVADLSAKLNAVDHAKLLDEALGDGRILPAHAEYWRAQPLAALSAFAAQAKPIAPLSGMQTDGQGLGGQRVAALSAVAEKMCAQMGVSPADYLAAQAQDAA